MRANRALLALTAIPVTVVALIVTPAVARPGSAGATVHDAADASPACRDIRTVQATATPTRASFTVTMAGATCGTSVPVVFIDTNRDGASDCQAQATNGSGEVRCANAFTGALSFSHRGARWHLSFPLSAIRNKHAFGAQVATLDGGGQFADLAPDGSGEFTVKVASNVSPAVKSITITDSKDAPPACRDIRQVRITATPARVAFVVTMAGAVCASASPVVFIDTNRDGSSECQAQATNGSGEVRCANKVTGSVTASSSGSQWRLSFPLSAIQNKHVFKVQVATLDSNGQFADLAPDGSGETTVNVG